MVRLLCEEVAIAHMAYFTLDRFIRSANAPVICSLVLLTAAKALELWNAYVEKKTKKKQKLHVIKNKMRKNRSVQLRRM